MNYQFSIKQNKRSLEILKHVYKNRITIDDEGYILLDYYNFNITNKDLIIHNQETLKLRRKNNKKLEFLNLFDNFHQREFIINKFQLDNDLNFRIDIIESKKIYVYSIVDDYDHILFSIKSKVLSNKKFIYLIMKFYNIE